MDRWPVPAEIYDFLTNHSQVTGAELARTFGIAGRTARRYRLMFERGAAFPRQTSVEKPVHSREMENWQQEVEEEAPFNVQEFFKWARQQARRKNLADPIITQDELTFDGNKSVGIIFTSCAHIGGRYTAYEDFDALYQKTLSIPRLYWGSLGDDIEGYLSQFPDQEAVRSQLVAVDDQIDVLEAIIEELSDHNKLIFGCQSQHGGLWFQRRHGDNPIKEAYLARNISFFDGSGYVRLNVGTETYFVAFAHEFPGFSQDNPSHPQGRALRRRFPNADLVVMGDKHTPAYQKICIYQDEFEMGNRASPYAVLLQAGTAKTGPDKYTISRWPVGELGWPIVVFHPSVHKIDVVDDLDFARWLLERDHD